MALLFEMPPENYRDPIVSGPTAVPALTYLSRAYRETFSAFASSCCTTLLLQPLGCTRLPISKAAVISMSATQLAAGCLDATSLYALQSRPFGMLVRSAAVPNAFCNAGIMRRAVSPSIGGDAVPEGGWTAGRRPPEARRPAPAGPLPTGSGLGLPMEA